MIEDIINAIGATAEISASYYKTLIASHIPENVAVEMSKAFISSFVTTTMGSQRPKDDDE